MSEVSVTKLVPLRRISARLHQKSAELLELSEKGEFPPIYNVGSEARPRWRVDPDAVQEWLEQRTGQHLGVVRERRVAACRQAVQEAAGGSRRRAGRRNARGSSAS